MQSKVSQNLIIYFAFLIVAVIGIFYGNAIKNQHLFLRVWESSNLLWLLIGIPFLFLQKKTDIPNFVDEKISNYQRFLRPIIIGVLFGILDVLIIKFLMHPEPYTQLPPFLQPFPYSLLLYFSGALEIEVFYRLVPITLILLSGKLLANQKYFRTLMWIAIVLTSIREPLEQLPQGAIWFVIYSFISGFSMNFFQGVYFTRAGFLASLSLRLGHYLIWHILLGIYVEYIELY